VLFAHGLIPFAKASGGSYDPVCFDARGRHKSGDTPVVRVDHEEILCNSPLGTTRTIAPSFRDLVGTVVARAGQARAQVTKMPAR
jgi:hypothetical protein